LTYKGLVALGREKPGERVKVHEYNRGHHDQIQRQAGNLAVHLREYVKRNYPLEKWVISALPSDDPWGGYEVFVTFEGEASSPQEKGKWKAQRRRSRTRQE
jgi:hypothetical protein